jgi:hypothetical protein
MLQAGVIVSDYATLMVEVLKDNARSEAGAVYGALDMPWAKLVGHAPHGRPSKSRPPMSHRKNDLGIPCR